jgi:sporulation protein YlmC with PRC-barrel domain
MRLGKDLLDKPIISVTDGRLVGKVKDLYLDLSLEKIVGLYLGSEGIFSRKSMLVSRDRLTLLGIDAVLAADSDVVVEEAQASEVEQWVRRQDVVGREVDTTGGTKVGVIGDVIINDDDGVIGFKLARVFVEGPIAKKLAVAREVVADTGAEDGVMTIDLAQAEQHGLSLS